MKPFDNSLYYSLASESENDPTTYVQPTKKGLELIAQYYEYKYQVKITFLKSVNLQSPFLQIKNAIESLPPNVHEARLPFILGGNHVIPFIYLKEGKKEAILYADSKGANPAIISELSEVTGKPIMAIESPRQADAFSCFTDAIVFCKDACAIDRNKKSFYISHLLLHLDHNKKIINHDEIKYFVTYLPMELLRIAQISKFIAEHKKYDRENKLVHKDLTLSQFHDATTQKMLIRQKVKNRKEKDIRYEEKEVNSFLWMKGIKFIDVMEVQYYISEIKNNFPKWNDIEIMNFIKLAKKELREQQNELESRKGLYDFATNYLNRIQLNHKEIFIEPEKTEAEITPHPFLLASETIDYEIIITSIDEYIKTKKSGFTLFKDFMEKELALFELIKMLKENKNNCRLETIINEWLNAKIVINQQEKMINTIIQTQRFIKREKTDTEVFIDKLLTNYGNKTIIHHTDTSYRVEKDSRK